MKVSIITSCYNRESTIRGSIESVLAQDYKDIEFVIVDGASKDQSVAVIEEAIKNLPKNVAVKFISEPDHGMYEAINKGIKMATGDIVGLVHSDDFLYDTHVITDVVRKFEDTEADFVYGDGVYVNAENINRPVRNWIGGPYYRWKVRCGWLPLHPTCYIKREVMIREGLYDESFKIAADTDLLVRYLYKANLKVEYLHRRIIRMRMGGLSTDSQKRRQMWNEDIRLYTAHGFKPVILTKLMKMAWKVPQFVEAKFINV
jgi:glycosyltransferase